MKTKLLIISFIIVFIVAFAGGRFTDTGGWYENAKPSITPPDYIFPIVWTALFFLIALSLYFAYSKAKNIKNKRKIMWSFGLNFIFNILWSELFFGLKAPFLAFFDLILLWISIVIMILVSWKINKKASYLLFPYLVWVSFAGILNYLILLKCPI